MAVNRAHMQSVAQLYLKGLNEGDLEQVLNLFSHQAVVVSPIYGKRPARDFYQELFEDTFSSNTSLIRTVVDESESSMVLILSYKWKLKDDRYIDFEVADLLQFDEHGLIELLSIYYDTFPLRGKS